MFLYVRLRWRCESNITGHETFEEISDQPTNWQRNSLRFDRPVVLPRPRDRIPQGFHPINLTITGTVCALKPQYLGPSTGAIVNPEQ
jgi:hypothetical protein